MWSEVICPFFHCLNPEIATSRDDIPCLSRYDDRYGSWRCVFYSECPFFVFSAFIQFNAFNMLIVICSVSPFPLGFTFSSSLSLLFLFVSFFVVLQRSIALCFSLRDSLC